MNEEFGVSFGDLYFAAIEGYPDVPFGAEPAPVYRVIKQFTSLKEAKLEFANYVNDNGWRSIRLVKILERKDFLSDEEWFAKYAKTE